MHIAQSSNFYFKVFSAFSFSNFLFFVSIRLKLPGRFYELNIHYGLFVGGLGDFREIFLGLWDNFRGCLNDLHYNGVDVLAKAKDREKSGGASSASTAVTQVRCCAVANFSVSFMRIELQMLRMDNFSMDF